MRAFISCTLPWAVRQAIMDVQNDLEHLGIQARWVDQAKLHLTLVFFTNLRKTQISLVEQVLQEAARQRHSISCKLDGLGGFPKLNQANISYVLISGELKKLQNLVKMVRKGLDRYHIDYDHKPFIAHITLGRLPRYQNLEPTVFKLKILKNKFLIDQISLQKSELYRHGPVYTQLFSVCLD